MSTANGCNGLPPPSGWSASDSASILLGMELGRLRQRTDTLARQQAMLARALCLALDTLILISKHFATRSQEPTTASGMATTAASIPGRTGTLFSTLSRLTKKFARKASPEVGLWLLGLLWRPYLYPIAFAAWGLVKAYLKWLEPLWRASFG